jgi:hypothetical protein
MKRALLLLLMASSVASANTPEVLPASEVSTACFASLEAAAVAGLDAAQKASSIEEFAGAVLISGNSYCYTTPVSNQKDGEFKIRILVPHGYKLAALYHTHPDYSESEFFSKGDIQISKSTGLISFIRVMSKDRTMVFDPQRDKAEISMLSMRAHGRMVGHG